MASIGNRAEQRRQWTPASAIADASEHHRAGRLDKAEALYRKVLQRDPGNVDALHLLGLAALNRGNPNQAIQLIGRALAAAPGFAPAYVNLGNAQRAANRLADACASYRRAIALQPDSASAHSNLGLVLYQQGDLTAALASGERALELDPDQPDILSNVVTTLRTLGRLESAETLARRAARLRPEMASLHANLGNLLVDLRRYGEATASYRRALELSPRFASARYGLGNSLRLSGDLEGAVNSYRAAVALNAGHAPLWNDLGRTLRSLGRFDEAIPAFRRALAIDPDFADAYRNLAICQQLTADNADIARVAALADDPDRPAEERATAGFALGKVLDDANRFDEAFAAMDKANTVYREARASVGERFDADALHREVDAAIARFTPAFLASVAGWGDPTELPVFIVGMPRSGTSLVEQIAASHSHVFGAGERKDIGGFVTELGEDNAQWERGVVSRLADAHRARLQGLAPDATRVIDKLPDNLFMLGIIATLFPSARVIFCERDPRDIGLSCFFQKFSPGQLMFSYDLANCGRRYRETARLVAHWHHVLKLRFLDMRYEDLVADLEGQSRRLIAFLGLDWEAACVDFHRTERTVETASGWQVRQPLYTRSVGRWRRYERHLGPMLAALREPGA